MSSLLVCSVDLVYDGCRRNGLVCDGDGDGRGNAGMDRPRGWEQIAGRSKNMLSRVVVCFDRPGIQLQHTAVLRQQDTITLTLSQPSTK